MNIVGPAFVKFNLRSYTEPSIDTCCASEVKEHCEANIINPSATTGLGPIPLKELH